MLDRLLHLRFQAPWLRPILSSDRFLHQLIARGFQKTLLDRARHINSKRVLLGPAFGGPSFLVYIYIYIIYVYIEIIALYIAAV